MTTADQDRRAAEEIALLPCPFCGGTAEIMRAMGETWVHCPACKGNGPAHSARDATVAAWNRRALVQKAREEERPKWQKIETAPKDSKHRLVWCPAWRNIYIVSWWVPLGEDAKPCPAEGFWLHVGGSKLTQRPTHWMSLPSPPESEG